MTNSWSHDPDWDDRTMRGPFLEGMTMEPKLRIAKAVQTACIEAAIRADEDAGLSGLCYEGRWECAIDAIRGVDSTPL